MVVCGGTCNVLRSNMELNCYLISEYTGPSSPCHLVIIPPPHAIWSSPLSLAICQCQRSYNDDLILHTRDENNDCMIKDRSVGT